MKTLQNTDANGATNQFTPNTATPNYQNVDEAQANETDFVSSGTIGLKEQYEFPAPVLGTIIHGVQQVAVSRKTDAGTVTGELISDSGSEQTWGTDTVNDGYSDMTATLDRNPQDGTAWSDGNISTTEFGFKLNNIVT